MTRTTTQKKFDWELVMETNDRRCFSYGASAESNGRPRRCSLHMLAAVTGREPEVIAKEMQESGLVAGYVCPDVKTPIFYLDRCSKLPGMIDTRTDTVWADIPKFLKQYPFSKYKGFKRFSSGNWADWKKPFECEWVGEIPAAEKPFFAGDETYIKDIRYNLEKAGYTPGHILKCTDCAINRDTPKE